MTATENPPFTTPPPPEAGSAGAAPGVTPIPGAAAPVTFEASAAGAVVSLKVKAMAGQSLPGIGILDVGKTYDVADTPDVRSRIESGFLELVEA